MNQYWIKLLSVPLLAAALVSCPKDAVSSIDATATPATIASAATSSLSATVSGTGAFNAGVNWNIVSGGGSLSASTGANVTYTAPSVTSSTAVQVKAMSAGDSSVSKTVTVTVQPASATPTLSVSPTTQTIAAGGSPVTFTATLTGASGAVNWSLTPASGAGTLSSATGVATNYTPPSQVPTATTAILTATSGSLSSTVQINVNPAPPTQFFTDPANGLDTNVGTQTQPLKTIKEALARMDTGAIKTTVLLAGTYSEASGETWVYTIPNSVTLKGNSAGVILQSTTKKAGFTFKQGATLSDLALTGFGTALTANTGSQTLTRLAFSNNEYALQLSGNAASALQDSSSSGAYTSIQAAGLSTVNVTGGSFGGTSNALTLQQSATASLTNVDISSGGFDTGGSSTLSLNQVKVHDVDSYVIYVRDSATLLNIEASSFYDNTGNASVILTNGIVNINNTSFSKNGTAIGASGGSITLTKSVVINNRSYGITTSKGVAFKMRGSTVAGNGSGSGSNATGISIDDATAGIDLGTASDPGGNTIQDNGGSSYPNLAVSGSSAKVQAAGNTWNASTQGADAAGRYPPYLVSPSDAYASGRNYYVIKGVSIQF